MTDPSENPFKQFQHDYKPLEPLIIAPERCIINCNKLGKLATQARECSEARPKQQFIVVCQGRSLFGCKAIVGKSGYVSTAASSEVAGVFYEDPRIISDNKTMHELGQEALDHGATELTLTRYRAVKNA